MGHVLLEAGLGGLLARPVHSPAQPSSGSHALWTAASFKHVAKSKTWTTSGID